MADPILYMPNDARYGTGALPHDGDTFWVSLDMGEHIAYLMDVRIRRLNAPELTDPGGPESLRYLKRLIGGNKTLIIDPYGTARSFQRRVCDVFVQVGTNKEWKSVADLSIAAGYGTLAAGLARLRP